MKLTTLNTIGFLVVLLFFIIYLISQNSTNRQKQNNKMVYDKKDSSLYFIGQNIYIDSCRQCHARKGHNHNFLNNIFTRVDTSYFKKYLTRQDSLIRVKDKYALSVKESYGNMGNSHNFKFDTLELLGLVEYLK